MSLLMPDLGLLFWMLIAFGIVFFLLAKYGFPAITKSVSERREFIDSSLKGAEMAQKKLSLLEKDGEAIIANANREQGRLLREANLERDKIVSQAHIEAQIEAQKELDFAKEQIEVQKSEAVLGIRRQVAELSCDIAEKILRTHLSDQEKQISLIEKMLDEVGKAEGVKK